MKKIVYVCVFVFVLVACDSTPKADLQPRDWDNTTYLYPSQEEALSTTYYKPYIGFIGDPMPFYDPVAKDYKIGYLQDYRPNPEATYHPIWGLSTTDGANYHSLDCLIPYGGREEQDAALGTGSFIYDEQQKLYYCFYTGHKCELQPGDNREMVMYATSPDFKSWTKCRTFFLRGNDYGYSQHDFRDPFVFRGDDNRYHMVVATTRDSKGCLAEFVSDNLRDWEHVGVFMTCMWDRFYECPDVFRMGDYWYLVYSEIHTAVRKVQYFKGRTLDELKACTRNDVATWPDDHEGFLDCRGFYAGKTASDGTNRYIWGWCPTRLGGNNAGEGDQRGAFDWAGSLVCHRVCQREDGSLHLMPADGLLSKYNQSRTVKHANFDLAAGEFQRMERMGYHSHLRFTVKADGAEDCFGISFLRGTKMLSAEDSTRYYTIMVNPESATRRKLNLEQHGMTPDSIYGMGFLADNDSYAFPTPEDNTYHIDIYTDNSVLTMYINDAVCYTNRIYHMARNCWSVNCYSGTIHVSDVQLTEY